MITYQVEKPEKGPRLIEYFLKYLTMFFVIGIALWAFLIYILTKLISDTGLTEDIYNYSLLLSAVIVVSFVTLEVRGLVTTLKLGVIYQIQFNEDKSELTLHMVNDYTGKETSKVIKYQALSIKQIKQKVEVKSEMTISIYNEDTLINTLKIAKTPWTVHPQIVELINKLRTVSSNNL